MAKFELKLPNMGESVAEATVTAWLKDVGDAIAVDDAVLEIATDKVDSEVVSEVDGILIERFFNVDDIAQVGQVLAIIETTDSTKTDTNSVKDISIEAVSQVSSLDQNEEIKEDTNQEVNIDSISQLEQNIIATKETIAPITSGENRFYSPLVKNIAKSEGVSQSELDNISGTGKDGRLTKHDILTYIENKNKSIVIPPQKVESKTSKLESKISNIEKPTAIPSGTDEIIEMTRMGKLVASHMIDSLQTSAHVSSFVEADVTNVWNWRNKVKDGFFKREGENLTFTPIFLEIVAKALRDFPLMNISVQGNSIVKKKAINLGMAAALPDGNLIVPVIKHADQLNLVGMTKCVNDLANRSRLNKLKPDEIKDGTYTVTNVGAFGTLMGTPIINQPQVGILALGAIRKVPAVIEKPEGDSIGIRYRMFLSHTYDHRVVNGALGGQFVKAVANYLENWDMERKL